MEINLSEIMKIVFCFIAGAVGGFVYIKLLKQNISNLTQGKSIIVNGILGFVIRIGLCALIFTGSALVGRTSGFVAACAAFLIVHFVMITRERGGGNVNKSR